MPINNVGDQILTVSSSVVQLTIPSAAKCAVLRVADDDIYSTEDGVNPSSTNGDKALNGDVLHYDDANYRLLLIAMKFLRVSTDAKVYAKYYDDFPRG